MFCISFEHWESRNHERALPHSFTTRSINLIVLDLSFLLYLFYSGKKVYLYNCKQYYLRSGCHSLTLSSILFLIFSLCSCIANLCLSTGSFICHTDLCYYYILSLYRKKILDPISSFSYHLIFLLPFRSKHLVGIVHTYCLYFFISNSIFNKLASVFCFHISTKAAFVQVTKDGNFGKYCLSYLASQQIRYGWLFPPWNFPSDSFQDTRDHTPYYPLFLYLFFSSSAQFLTVGMPQSSNMGPLLFAICTFPLDDPDQTMAFIPSIC